jgi:hypothetical protein
MYRQRDVCAIVVLTDFDHAVKLGIRKPSSSQRTRTLPYTSMNMAEPNVPPPYHIFRRDLESLFYVMVTVVFPKIEYVKKWPVKTGRDLTTANDYS